MPKAKPKPKPKKGGGGGFRSPMKQARRDVRLAVRPQLRELTRQKKQVRREYGDYNAKMGSLYGILDRTLGGLGGDQQTALTGIGNEYQQGVQGILGGLQQSSAPDQQAFLNTLGAFGLAGQNTLSTNQAREANYGASTRRQGGLERMQLGRNIRSDLQDAFDDIRFARRGIMADRGPMLTQRLDALREQQFARQMALRELALRRAAVAKSAGNDAAMAGFIRDYGGNILNSSQRRRKGGAKPKPGSKKKTKPGRGGRGSVDSIIQPGRGGGRT